MIGLATRKNVIVHVAVGVVDEDVVRGDLVLKSIHDLVAVSIGGKNVLSGTNIDVIAAVVTGVGIGGFANEDLISVFKRIYVLQDVEVTRY